MVGEKIKEEAIRRLQQLGIFEPYIVAFKKQGTVCFFENHMGYYIDEDTENDLLNKIKEIEQKYNCLVYAVTHEITDFGELYSFLIVSQYEDDWKYDFKQDSSSDTRAMAYVWNIDNDYCSEFGSIIVNSFGGGIKRIG